MAFAFAIPMAFAAQTGTVPALAWLLFLGAALWAVAYDTLCKDRNPFRGHPLW